MDKSEMWKTQRSNNLRRWWMSADPLHLHRRCSFPAASLSPGVRLSDPENGFQLRPNAAFLRALSPCRALLHRRWSLSERCAVSRWGPGIWGCAPWWRLWGRFSERAGSRGSLWRLGRPSSSQDGRQAAGGRRLDYFDGLQKYTTKKKQRKKNPQLKHIGTFHFTLLR